MVWQGEPKIRFNDRLLCCFKSSNSLTKGSSNRLVIRPPGKSFSQTFDKTVK